MGDGYHKYLTCMDFVALWLISFGDKEVSLTKLNNDPDWKRYEREFSRCCEYGYIKMTRGLALGGICQITDAGIKLISNQGE